MQTYAEQHNWQYKYIDMRTSMDKVRGNTNSENTQYGDLSKYRRRGRVTFGTDGKDVMIPYRTDPNSYLNLNAQTFVRIANAIDSRLNFIRLYVSQIAGWPKNCKILGRGYRNSINRRRGAGVRIVLFDKFERPSMLLRTSFLQCRVWRQHICTRKRKSLPLSLVWQNWSETFHMLTVFPCNYISRTCIGAPNESS